jgi:hypothetical protein
MKYFLILLTCLLLIGCTKDDDIVSVGSGPHKVTYNMTYSSPNAERPIVEYMINDVWGGSELGYNNWTKNVNAEDGTTIGIKSYCQTSQYTSFSITVTISVDGNLVNTVTKSGVGYVSTGEVTHQL